MRIHAPGPSRPTRPAGPLDGEQRAASAPERPPAPPAAPAPVGSCSRHRLAARLPAPACLHLQPWVVHTRMLCSMTPEYSSLMCCLAAVRRRALGVQPQSATAAGENAGDGEEPCSYPQAMRKGSRQSAEGLGIGGQLRERWLGVAPGANRRQPTRSRLGAEGEPDGWVSRGRRDVPDPHAQSLPQPRVGALPSTGPDHLDARSLLPRGARCACRRCRRHHRRCCGRAGGQAGPHPRHRSARSVSVPGCLTIGASRARAAASPRPLPEVPAAAHGPAAGSGRACLRSASPRKRCLLPPGTP